MPNSKYPKPDDRSNNVERIREIVRNTEDNLHDAEISAKNARREQSIEALKEEMQDEIAARKKGKA